MVITITLPFPPSVNSMWRAIRGRSILAKEVRLWWTLAEGMFLNQKRTAKGKISGPFEAEIVMDRSRRGRKDLDNRIKCVLDAAQKFGLVDNDRHCEKIIASWGDADGGCRLTLRSAL